MAFAVLAASRFAAEALLALCGSVVELVAVEVCGRVNSSKRSASRGWCMCRYEAEESLLWWFGVSLRLAGCLGNSSRSCGLVFTILKDF